MNIGLFFGSFNPVHIGHLAIAQYMWQEVPFDQVWFIVSPQNPHKDKTELAGEKRRFKMLNRSIKGHDALIASDIEFNLSKPSYTINTLKVLQNEYPSYSFSLIMGEDNLIKFNCWKAYEEILDHFKIYVYPRYIDEEIPTEIKEHHNVIYTEAPRLDISATNIRQGISSGKDMRFYLPHHTYKYISKHKLYR